MIVREQYQETLYQHVGCVIAQKAIKIHTNGHQNIPLLELENISIRLKHKPNVFINPPYSRKLKEAFVIRAIAESKLGKLCVLLLPVSTSTQLFHNHILPNNPKIEFIKGRLKFTGYNTKGEYVDDKCGMHDSMLVIFDGRKDKARVDPSQRTIEDYIK